MIAKNLSPSSRRSVLAITIALGLIAILGLVIISPFALAELAHSGRNWTLLSDIGQTYGAVSALLSSLALGGVVLSLLYQARDSRAAHEVASRTFQHELLKMELEDLSLMNAFGAPYGHALPSDFKSIRQFLFVQMWVSYMAGNYAIGESSEADIRFFAADELFRSAAGRSYWEAVGQLQVGTSRGRRNHFFRLLKEEYEKALIGNVPVSDPIIASDSLMPPRVAARTREERTRRLWLVAATAVIGAVGGRIWGRSSRGRRGV